MTTLPVNVERRVGQRFPFNLPVSLHDVSTAAKGLGFTQDLSSRGAFLFTVMTLSEGAEIELTLKMPSEITLGESMRVRCRGRVLRIVNAGVSSYPDGWHGYRACVSANNEHWRRTDTRYDGGVLEIRHSAQADEIWFALNQGNASTLRLYNPPGKL